MTAERIVRLGTVDSTQAVAFALAERGAADGTVVLADHQTAGRGRRGRSWREEAGSSLLASILVRPALPPARLPLLSYVAAVAAVEALQEVTGARARLKWPNDVLVGGRKIAGILLEARGGDVVVIGIGINSTQRRFDGELDGRATSVVMETGRPADREQLLQAFLRAFDAWRASLEGQGFAAVRERWLTLSETLGRHVRVGEVSGEAVGLDDEGALLVRDAGRVHRVTAGALD